MDKQLPGEVVADGRRVEVVSASSSSGGGSLPPITGTVRTKRTRSSFVVRVPKELEGIAEVFVRQLALFAEKCGQQTAPQSPAPVPASLAGQEQKLTVKEVAAFLRVSPEFVYKHAKAGDVPAERYGSSWRFKLSEVEAWAKNRAQPHRGRLVPIRATP